MDVTAETPLLEGMAASEVWRETSGDNGEASQLPSRPCFPPRTAPQSYSCATSNSDPDTFTFARKDSRGKLVPQAIAHRGYKAKYPENTMAAFQGAVEIGADALETDIHLTKDDVVVLAHVRLGL